MNSEVRDNQLEILSNAIADEIASGIEDSLRWLQAPSREAMQELQRYLPHWVKRISLRWLEV